MKTTVKYKGKTTILSDNLFDSPTIIKDKPKKSTQFGSLSLYYDGIHYFPNDIKNSIKRENKPYEIQGVFYDGKWKQDTFYITSDFKDFLLNNID